MTDRCPQYWRLWAQWEQRQRDERDVLVRDRAAAQLKTERAQALLGIHIQTCSQCNSWWKEAEETCKSMVQSS